MDISKLRTQFTGRVIGPEDGDYSKVRTVFYGGIDKKPAVIARACSQFTGKSKFSGASFGEISVLLIAYPRLMIWP